MLSGFQTGQEMVVRRQAQERQAAMQKAMADLAEKKNKTVEDYQQVMTQFPEMSKQVEQSLSMFNEQQQQNKINQLMNVYAPLKSGNTDLAKSNLDELITAYRNSGNDIEAKSMETLKQNIELDPKGAETSSELFLFKALGPEAFQKYLLQEQKTEAGLKGRYQPATEKGPDGTIWAMNDKGEVTVKDITGNVLEGEEAKKAWLKSKEYGVKIAEDTNYSRESGKLSAQKGTKAKIAEEVKAAEKGAEVAITKSKEFADQYEKIQNNIRTLDEGINIIEKGMKEGKDLGVGPIRRYLPRWGATANQLKNVSNRLGLNVVSSVTFGALSKAELDMATQTAMPTSLKGSELLQWMKDRKTAQEKLSGYLSEAARFIGSRGEDGTINTVQDWMDVVESKKTAPAQQQQQQQQQITATNPETGQKIVFKNGQWFDFKTNQPVQ
ncbi:MAG: hypothetical protein PVJ60_00020 [Phycisphaerales bacterium]